MKFMEQWDRQVWWGEAGLERLRALLRGDDPVEVNGHQERDMVQPDPPAGGSRADRPLLGRGEGADCTCWVRLQPDEDRYVIRVGAHHPECPVFRPSLDPVDNLHDAELRAHHEIGGRGR